MQKRFIISSAIRLNLLVRPIGHALRGIWNELTNPRHVEPLDGTRLRGDGNLAGAQLVVEPSECVDFVPFDWCDHALQARQRLDKHRWRNNDALSGHGVEEVSSGSTLNKSKGFPIFGQTAVFLLRGVLAVFLQWKKQTCFTVQTTTQSVRTP